MVNIKIPSFLDQLKDVTITSPADNEILAFDNSSSEWINQTPTEAGLDSIYLKLDGSNADQNINIGAFSLTANNLIAGNDITAGDSFFASGGAVGSPSYSFTGHTTSGIYLVGNGIGISSASTLIATFEVSTNIDFFKDLDMHTKKITGVDDLTLAGSIIGLEDGSVSLPSIRFAGSTSTGMWFETFGDFLKLSSAGTEVLSADTTAAKFYSDLILASGSITSISGAISFGNENLTTTGTVQAEHLYSTDDLQVDDNAIIGGTIMVSASVEEFSQFGASSTIFTPTNTADKLVSVKQNTATTGVRRAGLFMADFTGTGTGSARYMALNAFAQSSDASTGSLNSNVGGGGLNAGRYIARHGGSGTIDLAGGVSSLAHIIAGSGEDGTITDAYAFQAEPLDGQNGSGGITNAHGFWIKNGTGNIVNYYGIRIENITAGSTLNYAIKTGLGDVEFGGDTFWVNSGSGLPYGAFYGNNIAWTHNDFSGGGTFIIISDSDIVGGNVNNTTFQNDQELLIAKAGMYLVTWSLSVEVAVANKHIEVAPGINGTANVAGRQHVELASANKEEGVSGTTILDLAATNTLSLMLTNIDDDSAVEVHHINLTAVQIGGT